MEPRVGLEELTIMSKEETKLQKELSDVIKIMKEVSELPQRGEVLNTMRHWSRIKNDILRKLDYLKKV